MNTDSQQVAEDLFTSELYLVSEEIELKTFCLGEKQSDWIKLLVLLRDDNQEQAGSAELELLAKMVDWKEANLKREEVAIINLAAQKVSLLQLIKAIPSPNIIAFGITPDEIELQTEAPRNQIFCFRRVNFIFTSSLQQLFNDSHLKAKFFREAFKPMMNSPAKS